MAIEFNDNVLAKADKPLDAKSYVGAGHLFRYKENITGTYKFVGMVIRNTDDDTEWRWDGIKWNNITPDNNNFTITISEVAMGNGIMDETVFTLPAGYTQTNTIAHVNGITILSDSYTIVELSNASEITFDFPIELYDDLMFKKF